jgi:predicted RNA-binding protein Jag
MNNIKIDTIKKTKERTEKVLGLMGIQGRIMVLGEEGAVRVNISSKESSLLIGHHGENLFALRHILSLTCRELLPLIRSSYWMSEIISRKSRIV